MSGKRSKREKEKVFSSCDVTNYVAFKLFPSLVVLAAPVSTHIWNFSKLIINAGINLKRKTTRGRRRQTKIVNKRRELQGRMLWGLFTVNKEEVTAEKKAVPGVVVDVPSNLRVYFQNTKMVHDYLKTSSLQPQTSQHNLKASTCLQPFPKLLT